MKAAVFIVICGALGVAVGVLVARWVLEMLNAFDGDSVWEDEDDWL